MMFLRSKYLQKQSVWKPTVIHIFRTWLEMCWNQLEIVQHVVLIKFRNPCRTCDVSMHTAAYAINYQSPGVVRQEHLKRQLKDG